MRLLPCSFMRATASEVVNPRDGWTPSSWQSEATVRDQGGGQIPHPAFISILLSSSPSWWRFLLLTTSRSMGMVRRNPRTPNTATPKNKWGSCEGLLLVRAPRRPRPVKESEAAAASVGSSHDFHMEIDMLTPILLWKRCCLPAFYPKPCFQPNPKVFHDPKACSNIRNQI